MFTLAGRLHNLRGALCVSRRCFQTAHFYVEDSSSPRVVPNESFPVIPIPGEPPSPQQGARRGCRHGYPYLILVMEAAPRTGPRCDSTRQREGLSLWSVLFLCFSPGIFFVSHTFFYICLAL